MYDVEIADRLGVKTLRRFLTDRPVAYHPMLASAVGGAAAGLFLSQLLYWSDKGSDAEGWIWKTQEEWTKETGLTRIEQETARRKLRVCGVLEEHYSRLDHHFFYRIDFDRLFDLLEHSPMWETDSPESGKSTLGKVENPHSSFSETTPEITSENISISEDEKAIWPAWYATLYAIPGFKTSLKDAQTWLEKGHYDVAKAETTAYALKGKWPGPTKSPYHDSWATFQSWMRMPEREGTNGAKSQGALATESLEDRAWRIGRAWDPSIKRPESTPGVIS